MSEIKPCPFCGGEATVEPWHGGRASKRMVSCCAEDCSANPGVSGGTEAQAIAAWNRRSPAPSPASGESAEELSDAEAKRLYEEAEPVPFGAHEVERFVRTTVDPQSEVLALQKQRNDVYEERDRLVCALSKVFPSWLARHPDTDKAWDDDWRWIVFVQLPTGQATWHIHDRELPWFAHLKRRTENVWDGHTTEEKYRRLAALGGQHGK